MSSERAKPAGPLPRTPSIAAWRELTEAQREDFVEQVNAALHAEARAMGEGRPHSDAKLELLDALSLYYRSKGRQLYLAVDLSVLYPDEQGFCPDILAVVDVPNVVGDTRMAWVVADEGRGIDVAIEILHAGNRQKDLVDNVERYARVGVSEYFVFDRRDNRVVGYALPEAGARRYQRIVPQGGGVHSPILGVDFVVRDGRLALFTGTAELPGSSAHIGRLTAMLEDAQGEAEEAREQANEATAGLRAAVIAVLGARGVEIDDAVRARLDATTSPRSLQTWMTRALAGSSVADIFAELEGAESPPRR